MSPIADLPLDLALDRLRGLPHGSVVLLLGGNDSGKSTIAARLSLFDAWERVGVLDLDVGQGTIGPPATIGAALSDPGEAAPDSARRLLGTVFIGDVTPVRHIRYLAAQSARLLALARQDRPAAVVVDTCGLVTGRIGVALKRALIGALRPDVVFALDRKGDLGGVLDAVLRGNVSGLPVVIRTTPSSMVRPKSAAYRRACRAERFAAALAGANRIAFAMGDRLTEGDATPGRLVGLIGRGGWCLGIGRLAGRQGTELVVETAVTALDDVDAVVLGEIVLDGDGRTQSAASGRLPRRLLPSRALPVRSGG